MTMLVTYNTISHFISKGARYTDNIITFVSDYFSGVNNEWYILEHGPVPAVPASFYRNGNKTNIGWTYNTATNVLESSQSRDGAANVPFLSASITSNETTYSMDEFLEEFKVIHDVGKTLTPRIIVLCWQIYTRTWLDSATLTVIDSDGEEHTVDAFGDGGDEWIQMVYVPDEAYDADVEGEEEEEAEETEETEEEQEEAEETEETEEDGGVAGVLLSNTPVVELLHEEQGEQKEGIELLHEEPVAQLVPIFQIGEVSESEKESVPSQE